MKNEDRDSKKCRVCRSGAGVEKIAGKGDTPGFKARKYAQVVHDPRGFDRLELPRGKDNTRLLQSSTPMLQSWRANCDLQIILYQSSPSHPDPADIASVTDYLVAYQCKGNESLSLEKRSIKQTLLELKQDQMLCSESGEGAKLSWKILNWYSSN